MEEFFRGQRSAAAPVVLTAKVVTTFLPPWHCLPHAWWIRRARLGQRLRSGNAAAKVRQADDTVVRRLRSVVNQEAVRKLQGRAGLGVDRGVFNGRCLYRLYGTIRHPGRPPLRGGPQGCGPDRGGEGAGSARRPGGQDARPGALQRKPGALSGGQRQRVAMGRTILRERQAFLMDEPLSNLDAKLRVSWDVVIGADQTGQYKPRPEAYLRRAAALRLDPGEVMLAAARNHDLAAARECGLATAFISRPTEFGAEQTTDLAAEQEWAVDVRAITGLAEAMGCGPRRRNEVTT